MGDPDDNARGLDDTSRAANPENRGRSKRPSTFSTAEIIKSIAVETAARGRHVVSQEEAMARLGESSNPLGTSRTRPRDLGNFVHTFAEELLPAKKLPRDLSKEVEIKLHDGTKVKLDRVDYRKGVIYEIKPNTPAEIEKGRNQLEKYAQYMDEHHPFKTAGGRERPWRTELVKYNKRDLAKVALQLGEISVQDFDDLPDPWKDRPASKVQRGIGARLQGTNVRAKTKKHRRLKHKRKHKGKLHMKGGPSTLGEIVFDLVGGYDAIMAILQKSKDYLFGTGPDPIEEKLERMYPKIEGLLFDDLSNWDIGEILFLAQKSNSVYAYADIEMAIGTPKTAMFTLDDTELIYVYPRISGVYTSDGNDRCNNGRISGFSSSLLGNRERLQRINDHGLWLSEYEPFMFEPSVETINCRQSLEIDIDHFRDLLAKIKISGFWAEYVNHHSFKPPSKERRVESLIRVFELKQNNTSVSIKSYRAIKDAAGISLGEEFKISDVSWNRDSYKLKFRESGENYHFDYVFDLISETEMSGYMVAERPLDEQENYRMSQDVHLSKFPAVHLELGQYWVNISDPRQF